MFMIDMHGTRISPPQSSSSRTPGERYCGSCIARPTRSYSLGIDAGGAAGRHLARQLAQVEHDRILAAPDRQAHAEALSVDQLGLGRQADQMDLVAAEQQLGGEQRPVGRAHEQNVVAHIGPLSPWREIARTFPAHGCEALGGRPSTYARNASEEAPAAQMGTVSDKRTRASLVSPVQMTLACGVRSGARLYTLSLPACIFLVVHQEEFATV